MRQANRWKCGFELIAAVTVLVLLGYGAAVAGKSEAPTQVDDPRMAFLKSLEGDWKSVSETDYFHDGLFQFRITAGGGAVEERSMAGTPTEMLTVYHMDGADLVGTHYCMMNKHPRVKAAPRLTADSLSFECDGHVANARSHDEQHIHDWKIQRQQDGTLYYTAGMFADGKRMEAPSVKLARK